MTRRIVWLSPYSNALSSWNKIIKIKINQARWEFHYVIEHLNSFVSRLISYEQRHRMDFLRTDCVMILQFISVCSIPEKQRQPHSFIHIDCMTWGENMSSCLEILRVLIMSCMGRDSAKFTTNWHYIKFLENISSHWDLVNQIVHDLLANVCLSWLWLWLNPRERLYQMYVSFLNCGFATMMKSVLPFMGRMSG